MQCHFEIHESFMGTGMGKSISKSERSKSSLILTNNTHIIDSFLNFSYYPFWENDSLYLKEISKYHQRLESVDYIIGSGHHTNSHLWSENGYLHQMPFTYYTQKSKIDFPPGFENGYNSRFSRKITLECMSCHNAYPDIVLGSENKYTNIPEGIDCERCHGPGGAHVRLKRAGEFIDTSKYIDYSIVNPSNLELDRQFDICMRCHLQGNTVLSENKSFYDFIPGMNLSDVMTVFLPRYENDESFIMASHVDRFKQSSCFINSEMSCISCHDPHHSVNKTSSDFFNNKCSSCHDSCKESPEINNDCISCHMPKSSSIDIPHVTITDHKIGIHNFNLDDKKGPFLGLFPVNNSNPDFKTLAIAYIQHFEKFSQENYLLDSASFYLNKYQKKEVFNEWIHLYFLDQDYLSIINLVYSLEKDVILNKVSYDNEHAWTLYRIGEAFFKQKQWSSSVLYYQESVNLAPFVLDFRLKLALGFTQEKNFKKAIEEYEWIIKEFPKMEIAWANLGFVYFQIGELDQANYCYDQCLDLNPRHLQTLLNKAALYLVLENFQEVVLYLEQILDIYPSHPKAIQLLEEVNAK